MTIDDVVRHCLMALFRNDFFKKEFVLKGGQWLRLREELRTRLSGDIDFSVKGKIENPDQFEETLRECISAEFASNGFYAFAFKVDRRPKKRRDGQPDWWGGWRVSFKLIDYDKRTLPRDALERSAITPQGANSSVIAIDVSEYEYCESVERMKIDAVSITVYSRALVLLEKLRAICQQHPAYPLKGNLARSRDYYDIEQLWRKVVSESAETTFIKECREHLPGVFAAKEVDLELLQKIFDSEFVKLQESGWQSVVSTVNNKVADFSFYNEVVRLIVKKLLE
jgi:predicted nucleotidyltransferase component of viral defense system